MHDASVVCEGSDDSVDSMIGFVMDMDGAIATLLAPVGASSLGGTTNVGDRRKMWCLVLLNTVMLPDDICGRVERVVRVVTLTYI